MPMARRAKTRHQALSHGLLPTQVVILLTLASGCCPSPNQLMTKPKYIQAWLPQRAGSVNRR